MQNRVCAKTVMDTTDPYIYFDENGISDYYHNYINKILPSWNTEKKGMEELNKILQERIKILEERIEILNHSIEIDKITITQLS